MTRAEIVIYVGAILLGIFYGLPALMERRGSLWKDMAEERDAALKELHEQLSIKEQEVKDAQQRIGNLELRTDLTMLSENIVKEREQGVLLVKAELAGLQKSIVETEERILGSYEAHETRAQERHEKLVEALESLTVKLQK
jgi:recombinational DNA repair ATPase RecF